MFEDGVYINIGNKKFKFDEPFGFVLYNIREIKEQLIAEDAFYGL